MPYFKLLRRSLSIAWCRTRTLFTCFPSHATCIPDILGCKKPSCTMWRHSEPQLFSEDRRRKCAGSARINRIHTSVALIKAARSKRSIGHPSTVPALSSLQAVLERGSERVFRTGKPSAHRPAIKVTPIDFSIKFYARWVSQICPTRRRSLKPP